MSFKKFVKKVIEHEGLEPNQTPFRITDPKMGKWTSMFDNTKKIKLNPAAKKSPGREKFLYTQNAEDVEPAVSEQFTRYQKRNPAITVEDAVKTFDQTGAKGKLEYLKKNGIDAKAKLADLRSQDDEEESTNEIGKEVVRQITATSGKRG